MFPRRRSRSIVFPKIPQGSELRSRAYFILLRPARTEEDCLKILRVLSPSVAAWRVTEKKTTTQTSTPKKKLKKKSINKLGCVEERGVGFAQMG